MKLLSILFESIDPNLIINLNKPMSETINHIHEKYDVNNIGYQLRLSPNWVEHLYSMMETLMSKKLQDFHAGNIGIRRRGGEGELIFFDL